MTEQVLGGYVLHEVVGWGAVGQVYRATDPGGGQAAVKVLRPELAHDPEVVGRFLWERSMAPGAPDWGSSPYGYQSFTAQSNTLTYVGVTWGSGNYQPGAPGVTYYVVSTAPAGSWDLFWWSCTPSCPNAGRNSAALSDQNQMVVK